jgi:hypothetical protein
MATSKVKKKTTGKSIKKPGSAQACEAPIEFRLPEGRAHAALDC